MAQLNESKSEQSLSGVGNGHSAAGSNKLAVPLQPHRRKRPPLRPQTPKSMPTRLSHSRSLPHLEDVSVSLIGPMDTDSESPIRATGRTMTLGPLIIQRGVNGHD